jgi:hypothetical protein
MFVPYVPGDLELFAFGICCVSEMSREDGNIGHQGQLGDAAPTSAGRTRSRHGLKEPSPYQNSARSTDIQSLKTAEMNQMRV